jgi:hypothetical protein
MHVPGYILLPTCALDAWVFGFSRGEWINSPAVDFRCDLNHRSLRAWDQGSVSAP